MGMMVSARATERGIAARRQARIAAPIDWEAIARGKAAIEEHERRRVSRWFAAAQKAVHHASLVPMTPREETLDIVRRVAAQHGYSVEQVQSPRRFHALVTARFHAVYEVARLCPHMSWPQIGAVFNRDHTSLLHAASEWPARAAALGIECQPLNREGKL